MTNDEAALRKALTRILKITSQDGSGCWRNLSGHDRCVINTICIHALAEQSVQKAMRPAMNNETLADIIAEAREAIGEGEP